MDESQRNRLRTYAWSYFAYHADQRVKSFNLYLLLMLGITGGIVALMAKPVGGGNRYAACLCFLAACLSLLFCLLDRRNAELVKNGETALKHLDTIEKFADDSNDHSALALFTRDEANTTSKRFGSSDPHISFSDIFCSVFVLFGVLGTVFGYLLF